MKTQDIQIMIFEATGLKTSVKKGTGSMKGYFKIWPIFQGGKYPDFPPDFTREMDAKFPRPEPNPNFFSTSDFNMYDLEDDSIHYKRERKPKEIQDLNVRQWGSKNSQMRLDKAAARYAKKLEKGNCARYY